MSDLHQPLTVRRVSKRLAGLLVSLLLLVGTASPVMAVDVSPRFARQLHRHLFSSTLCQGMQLLAKRSRRCWPVAPPPAELAGLAEQLKGLGPIDALLAQRRETGESVGPIGRCMIAIQSEVRSILAARLRGLERPRRGRGLPDLLCDDVEVPAWPGEFGGLGSLDLTGACRYTIDAGGRVRGAALGHCVRTLAGSWLAEAGIGPPLPRPNMIVILVDDQRWDTIDATHSPMPAIGMPAMPATYSRLAGEGVTFTQAVVTTPICGPSRGSFFTGLHTHRHGMLANAGLFGPQNFADGDTWATRLDEAGYRTGFMGKYANAFTDLWTPGVDEPYIPPGWDEFYVFDHPQSVPQTGFSMVENGVVVSYDTPDQPYSTDLLGQKALDFIDESVEQTPDVPFALWLSTTTPHYPWDPAERHLGAFDQLQVVLYPNAWEEDVTDKPPWLASYPTAPTGIQVFGHRNFRARQLEMQLSTDEMVAALLDRLEAHGIGDDTIILYVSDNGHGWGEHRWATKGCPWEECLRVPMLLRYPRLIPGPRTEKALVANVDLVPTLLGLAGADMADDLDGVDLGDALRGVAAVPERDVLFETYAGTNLTYAGVRADGLKYLVYRNGFEELYDLEADPWELDNAALKPEYDALRLEMRSRLEAMWPGFDAVTQY